MNHRAIWPRVLRYAVSISLIALIIHYVDWPLLVSSLREARILYLLSAAGTVFVSMAFRALRWRALLATDPPVRVSDLFLLGFTGIMLNVILPGSLGDIAKAYYAHRRTGLKEVIVSSTVLDKLVGLASVFLLGGVAALAQGISLYTAISLPLAALFLGVVAFPRVVPWPLFDRLQQRLFRNRIDVGKLRAAFSVAVRRKLGALGISLLGWLVTAAVFHLVCTAFALPVRFSYVIALVPLITLARILPITVSGLGTQEALVVHLFSGMGITASDALLVSLAFTLLTTFIPGAIGLLIVWRLRL